MHSIPASEEKSNEIDKLQPDNRILDCTIVCFLNAMIHLNSRMVDLWLLLKDYTIIIMWGKTVGKGGGEKSLCLWNHIKKKTINIYIFLRLNSVVWILYP